MCVSGSCFGSYTCLLFSSVPQRYFIVNLIHHDFFFFNIGCQSYNLSAQESIFNIVIYLQCLKDLVFFFDLFAVLSLTDVLCFSCPLLKREPDREEQPDDNMPPKFKRHLNDDEVTGSIRSERVRQLLKS